MQLFKNFDDAAQKLALTLLEYKDLPDTFIFGILHAGAIIAKVLSDELNLPWDVLGIKKIGVPFDPELAVGAVAPDGTLFIDDEVKSSYHVSQDYIEETVQRKLSELRSELAAVRGNAEYQAMDGKVLILTDDGIATGATMHAAIAFVRKLNPRKLIVAVPVISPDRFESFRECADEVKAVLVPEEFMAVGEFYWDFPLVSDEEVAELIKNRKNM
jgi:predicted phosphoribosyltransferase